MKIVHNVNDLGTIHQANIRLRKLIAKINMMKHKIELLECEIEDLDDTLSKLNGGLSISITAGGQEDGTSKESKQEQVDSGGYQAPWRPTSEDWRQEGGEYSFGEIEEGGKES